MKSNILSILAVAGAMLGLTTACADDPNYKNLTDKTGSVSLADLEATVDETETVLSRSTISTDNFLLTILDSDGQPQYESTVKDRNEVVTLPAGTGYTVMVKSHELENVAWEAPYYEGTSSSFAVEANKVTKIDPIECKFANIRVSVSYSEALLSLMESDASVTVTCSEYGTSHSFPSSETRSLYFKASESTTLVAEFSGTIQGEKVTFAKTLEDVVAGQHRKLNFTIKEGNSEIDLTGQVVSEISNESLIVSLTEIVTESIDGLSVVFEEELLTNVVDQRPGQEEIPDGDDGDDNDDPDDPAEGGDSDAITFYSSTLSFTETMNPSDYSTAIVDIIASNGIQNLYVTIATDSSEFESVLNEMGMPLNFDLAHTANDNEKTIMDGFGFPTDSDVIGKTSISFNISEFVPLLNIYGGVHKFVLKVVDQADNSSSVTLTFKVVK